MQQREISQAEYDDQVGFCDMLARERRDIRRPRALIEEYPNEARNIIRGKKASKLLD